MRPRVKAGTAVGEPCRRVLPDHRVDWWRRPAVVRCDGVLEPLGSGTTHTGRSWSWHGCLSCGWVSSRQPVAA